MATQHPFRRLAFVRANHLGPAALALMIVLPLAASIANAATYYSRNGGGNWNTAATWSTTSHTGTAAASPPGQSDAVLIGDNDVVTLDVSVANNNAVTVESTGRLNCGLNTLNGTGTFTLSSGGTLEVQNGSGITTPPGGGNIGMSARSYSTGANYTFDLGGGSQNTGNGLPATVNNLSVNVPGGLSLTSSVTVNGTLTITGGTLMVGSNTLTIAGPLSVSSGTMSFNNNGTCNYAQTSGSISVPGLTYGYLTISGAATRTLAGNASVQADLTVSGGTFDLGSYAANRSATGGTLTVAAGATLKIGGTNGLPANFTTTTLASTSTIEFSGTNQTVASDVYGNLTMSGSGTKSLPGGGLSIAGNFTCSGTSSSSAGSALSVTGSFTINNGATFSAGSYNHSVQGGFSNNGTYTAGTSTLTFSGSSAQALGGTTATTFNNLTLNDAAGLTLNTSAAVGGTLTLSSGNITTGATTLSINSTGSVSRASGHIVGNLAKYFAAAALAKTFEIGTGASYTPIAVTFGSVTVAGYLTATTAAGDHASIATATINPAKTVNRTWTLTNGAITFTNYGATLTFVAGDVDAGANTSNVIVGRYNAGWTYPTVGTKTATTTQITGVTAFGAFQIGENAWDISGTVFEDKNYGGGAGRSRAASSGVGSASATVEVYNSGGAYLSGTTTDASGNYTCSGLAAGTYYIRVVTDNVRSNRTGWSAACKPVMTYRTDATSGTPAAVTDFVGGTNPAASDPGVGSAGATFNTTTYVWSAVLSGTAQAVTKCVLGSANMTGVDFGFNFNTVVNTNNAGQGSLRQAITNMNTLGGDNTLAQAGLVAGEDNTVFMISNGTSGSGLRSANNYFAGGVATISPTSALPALSTAMNINATCQPGYAGVPIIELNGAGAGAGVVGLTLSGGSTTVRGLVINRFAGDGIDCTTSGGDSVAGCYIGTNAAGTVASANGGDGVYINSVANCVIGGTAAGLGNAIMGNAGRGVRVTGASALGNAILGNSIYGNGTLGIDLGGDGVTANNNTKNAAAPNYDMDFPVIAGAQFSSATSLTLSGYIGTSAGHALFASARVEFFKSDGDGTGYGEGQMYVGFLTADANGNFSGTLTVSGIAPGDPVTATATDAGNNTSEFGPNFSSGGTFYSKGSLAVDLPSNWNLAADGSSLNAAQFGNNSTWIVQASHAMTLSGSTSWNVGANGLVQISGTWTNSSSGAVTAGTLQVNSGGTYAHATAAALPGTTKTFSSGSTVSYAGASQTVEQQSYSNLTIAGSGTKSAAGNLTIAGNLSVNGGMLDLGGSTANRSTAGGTLTVVNGAALKIGGTGTLPANYTTHAVGATSTIEYSGTTQQIAPLNSAQLYGNLTLSGGGTKTAAGALTINGDLTIGSGVTFAAGSSTHTVQGNWSNSGAFTASTSTIQFTGSSTSTLTGATTFNGLTLNKNAAATTLTLNSPVTATTVTMTQGLLAAGSSGLTILSGGRSGNGLITGALTRTQTFSSGTGYAFEGPNTTLTFDAGGTLPTSITVTTMLANPGGNTSCDPIDRSYAISQTGGTGFTCTLRLHYEDTEVSAPNSETSPPLKIWRRISTGPDVWTREGSSSSSTTGNWVEQTGLANLGAFTLSSRTVANMSLSLAQSATHPSPGDQVTYTVSYANTGDGSSTNTLVTCSVPLHTSYVTGSTRLNNVAKTDASDADEVTVAGSSISINLGSVAAGAAGTISYAVSVN